MVGGRARGRQSLQDQSPRRQSIENTETKETVTVLGFQEFSMAKEVNPPNITFLLVNSHGSELPFSDWAIVCVLDGEGPGKGRSTQNPSDVGVGEGEGQDPLLGLQDSMKVNQVMRQGLLES